MRGLDTYYGRKVEKIKSNKDGTWYVELEGGVRIVNQDKRFAKPEIHGDVKRLTFYTGIFDANGTQMVLGVVDSNQQMIEEFRVKFNPLKYQIHDKDHSDEPFSPQAGGYGVKVTVPELPHEREQEGPEEG